MTIHDIYKIFMDCFRSRRMKAFADMFAVSSETRIIDVGGTLTIWSYLAAEPQVTMVNIECTEWCDGRFRMVEGDGTNLRFGDNEFDICFSNSVIEHVGDA